MRIIITTGGTGGHIFPALALYKEIKRENPNAYILFVGAEYGMEKEICSKENIPFIGLNVQGFVGRGLKSIKALFLLVKAYFKARKVIKNEKIEKVIGFGGYASAPSILAAKSLNIKIFLAEQNAFPGAVNRLFSKYAEKIMLSIPIKDGILDSSINNKCVLTGNPVRSEIAKYSFEDVQERKTKKLLILGGSLGAKSINSLIIECLDDLYRAGVEITHQCGKNDFKRVQKAYEKSSYSSSVVKEFIDDMENAYAQADFIVARAGASTLSEIACMSKASLLIPFPFAAHNHQYFNAKSFEDKQACIMIEEKEVYADNMIINKEKFLEKLLMLAENSKERYSLARNVKTFAKPRAVHEMYTIIKG